MLPLPRTPISTSAASTTTFRINYRYTEWARDFNTNYAKGGLPTLSLVYLMHDHTGNFGTAIAGVNTPELQQADNDYAVGLLVQTISSSIYANKHSSSCH